MNIFDTLIANRPKQEVTSTIQGSGASNFFSDEQSIYNRMLQDGLDDTKARSLITQNRQKQLGQITAQEKDVLLKMQQDGLDSKKAVELVRKNRYSNLPAYKKAAKFVFDASVGATGMATEQVGKVGGFFGAKEWERKGIEARDIAKRTTGDSIGAKTGETILGAGEMFAVSPTKVAPTLFGRTVQGAAAGGIIGAGEEIVTRGSEATVGDVAKSAATDAAMFAAATPLIEKVALPILVKTAQATYGAGKGVVTKGVKYGTAAQKGGLEGLEKSIVRDIKKPFKSVDLKGLAPKKAASLSTRANRFTSGQEKKFKEMTGQTSGEFAVTRGMTKVGDDAVEASSKNYLASIKEADDALGLIDGTYKVTKGPDFVKEMLTDLSSRLKNTIGPGRRKIELLLKKYNTTGLSMSELNTLKRVYARNFKYSFAEKGSEAALRSTNLQDGVRKFQFKTAKEQGFHNLDKINKTTQAWRTYTDNLGQSLARKGVNNEVNLTSWIALSGGEPTNLALFLGKETLGHSRVKSALIKGLGKQTKPSIIKANRPSILKSNIKKRSGTIDNILRDRVSGSSSKLINKPKPKALPVGKKEPIITPQTKEKAIIAESKKELTGKIKKPGKYDKGGKYGKGGYINPQAILDDIAKLPKATAKQTEAIARNIVKKLGVAKEHTLKALRIVKEYIKKYGAELKNKLGDMIDDIADKVGARAKFIDDSGKSLDDFKEVGTTKSASLDELAKEAQEYGYKFTTDDLKKWNSKNILELKERLAKIKKDKDIQVLLKKENSARKGTKKTITKDKLSSVKSMKKGHDDLFKTDTPRPKDIKDVKYIERAVSKAEYDSIVKNGYIKSNASLNFPGQEKQTLYHVGGHGTSFYLPKDGGYIIKVKVNPNHKIKYNSQKEVFTTEKISIDDIVEIQGGDGIVKINATKSADLISEAKKLGFETKGDNVVLYRGYGSVTDKKGNYFTGDKDYAREFSMMGDDTLRKIEVSPKEIYKPKVLPEAVNELQITKAINEAKKRGFKAIYVDEGGASTPSIFFINAK